MTKRKDRFVVGYRPVKNVVYGKSHKGKPLEFAEPMTRVQAEREVKRMPCKGAVIFELVPVGSDRR